MGLVPVPTHRGRPSTPAADLEGTDLEDRPAHVAVCGTEAWTLLVFLSSGCDGCKEVWDALADPAAAGLTADERVVAIVRERDDPEELATLAPPGAEVVRSDAAWRDYRVQGPPFFALVDGGDPQVATEGVAWGIAQIAAAVRTARARSSGPG